MFKKNVATDTGFQLNSLYNLSTGKLNYIALLLVFRQHFQNSINLEHLQ